MNIGILVVLGLIAIGPLMLIAGIWGMAVKDRSQAGAALVIALVGGVFTALDAYLLHWFYTMPHSKGRLLRIGGKQVRARSIASEGWLDDAAAPVQCDAELGAAQRRRLAAIWTLYASMEHASVPAFGRLAESLVRLGAPADLVRRAHEAAVDEVRHAQRCYSVASDLSGAPVGPAPLEALDDRTRAPTPADPLADLARGSLRDGVLAEGVAAATAAAALTSAHRSFVGVLSEIARDEAAHARLGADVVRWCVGREPAIAAQIPGWIATWRAEPVSNALLDQLHEPWMERYGVLSPVRLDALRRAQLDALERDFVGSSCGRAVWRERPAQRPRRTSDASSRA